MCIHIKHVLLFVAILIFLASPHFSYANGGVSLGATRVIYPLGGKQVSLAVNNNNDSTTFLIQSWVSDDKSKKTSDFIITPPLFTLKPNKENTLRIMYSGQLNLPHDRESVYYINSKAIPSMPESARKENTLQIATQTVIKLFVRPKGLSIPSADAPGMLRCQLSTSELVISNPSPYYVSLVNISVGGKSLDHTMVPPKGDIRISAKGGKGIVKFQTVNDYGATTQQMICPV